MTNTKTRNFLVEWPSDFFARSRRDEGVVRAPQLRSNADIAKKAPVPSEREARLIFLTQDISILPESLECWYKMPWLVFISTGGT